MRGEAWGGGEFRAHHPPTPVLTASALVPVHAHAPTQTRFPSSSPIPLSLSPPFSLGRFLRLELPWSKKQICSHSSWLYQIPFLKCCKVNCCEGLSISASNSKRAVTCEWPHAALRLWLWLCYDAISYQPGYWNPPVVK